MDFVLDDFILGVYVVVSTMFLVWIGRMVKTLKDTINAQSNTLDAFKDLLDGMKTVLDSTDETVMLGRLKAYKEFVDLEQEAYKKRIDEEKGQELDEFKGKAMSGVQVVLKEIERLSELLVTTFARLVTYVPPAERVSIIESLTLDEEPHISIKERFNKLAKEAPYISPEVKSGRIFWQRLAQGLDPLSPPSSPTED